MRLAGGMTTILAVVLPETRTKRSRIWRSFSLFSAPPMGTIQPRVSPAGVLLGIKRSGSWKISFMNDDGLRARCRVQSHGMRGRSAGEMGNYYLLKKQIVRLGAWSGQQLDPVQPVLDGVTRRIGDAHLGKSGVHDVLTVTGTVEPALHHFVGRFGPVGDVFA